MPITWHNLFAKVGTIFTDKRRSLGRYISLADSGHSFLVFFFFFRLIHLFGLEPATFQLVGTAKYLLWRHSETLVNSTTWDQTAGDSNLRPWEPPASQRGIWLKRDVVRGGEVRGREKRNFSDRERRWTCAKLLVKRREDGMRHAHWDYEPLYSFVFICARIFNRKSGAKQEFIFTYNFG
jgi:hypothetical protein